MKKSLSKIELDSLPTVNLNEILNKRSLYDNRTINLSKEILINRENKLLKQKFEDELIIQNIKSNWKIFKWIALITSSLSVVVLKVFIIYKQNLLTFIRNNFIDHFIKFQTDSLLLTISIVAEISYIIVLMILLVSLIYYYNSNKFKKLLKSIASINLIIIPADILFIEIIDTEINYGNYLIIFIIMYCIVLFVSRSME